MCKHNQANLTIHNFSPLIPAVIITSQSSHIDRALRGQMGVKVLGKIVNFRWRKSFPVSFISLQPALTPPGWFALVSHSGKSEKLLASYFRLPCLFFPNVYERAYLPRPSVRSALPLLMRSCRQQTMKDTDMARMTMLLTTDASTATLSPRSSGLGMATTFTQ